MKRVAITGSSGYLGKCLIRFLREHNADLVILGIDIEPSATPAPDEFRQLDIRSEKINRVLAEFEPDTVVHLAFVVKPIHNEREMTDINIRGTENVLAASAAANAERILSASSTTALGAWPENPAEMDDRHTPRGRPEFCYARNKSSMETVLTEFAARHPEVAVSWTRPCIVGGPTMDNYLRRALLHQPIVVLLDGEDTPMQLVHEDDVSRATWQILQHDGRGPYNVAPPDSISISDFAEQTPRRAVSLPFWLVWSITTVAWGVRIWPHEFPPGLLYYLRYSWIAAPNRLRDECGFQFQYTSRQTLLETLGVSEEQS